MTKSELISAISNATDIKQKDVGAMIAAQDAILLKALAEGQDVMVGGLGKLRPINRAARSGRNPQTGETVPIAARTDAKFTPAKALKEALNA